eukprot:TRINITY_DN6245_c0_g1_i1.p2 TRINITY_DN6245_c0_g1~~TRINITY_DN6245_c0_g1_i1.p2  ORF type:complete len:164 (+),score=38.89 TRINITY_DN6245_c0_g1_i1:1023-1514(+)
MPPTREQMEKIGEYSSNFLFILDVSPPTKYMLSRSVKVTNINECDPGVWEANNKRWNDCDAIAKCRDLSPGFLCICPPNFSLAKDNRCVDLRVFEFPRVIEVHRRQQLDEPWLTDLHAASIQNNPDFSLVAPFAEPSKWNVSANDVVTVLAVLALLYITFFRK